MSRDPSTYIDDLLDRLDRRELLPGRTVSKSSEDYVSWHAAREAEKIDNPAYIPCIRESVRTAKKVRTFQKLAIILGGLIRNTRDPDALSVYKYLMQRSPKSDNVWHYILEVARKARIQEAKPHALRILEKPFKRSLAFSAAIEYLGTMGGAEAIPIIGTLLDADCDGKCHPMYCAFALGEIGHPDAIPYLRRAAERHAKARKKAPTEVRAYSLKAIERIQTSPPLMIEGLQVCMWMIPPDLPERIAVCSTEEGFAIISCDSSWQLNDKRFAPSMEAAKEIAGRLAGVDYLRVDWHSRNPL